MKRAVLAVFGFGLALGCCAETSICDLELPSLAPDGSVEVAFSSRADWNFNDVVRFEDMYVREGGVIFIPYGRNSVEKRGPLRLAVGESIRLSKPHEGCSLEAVIDQGRVGVLVKWALSLPGLKPTGKQEFLPIKGSR